MTFLIFGFFLLLVAGMPIFLAFGVAAFGAVALESRPLLPVAQEILDDLNSPLLMSVPFFVMAATIMQRGGVARALLDAVGVWVGMARGGLAIVAILGCGLFAAISGSSVATAMAMGTILIPEMLRRNYDAPFATGTLAAGGTLGILIPPSLPLILYGIIGDQSVPRLFVAGVIPGLLLTLVFVFWVVIYVRWKTYPAEPSTPDVGKSLATTAHALPALSVPAVVAVGIYGGIVTVTEAAAVSAAVALAVSLVAYRAFSWRDILEVMCEALRSAAMIMIIIVMALLFGHSVTESGVPVAVARLVSEYELSAWQFLLAVNALLFIMGMFLEVASTMLLTLPVLIPLLGPLGIDPVHFAIIVVVNMEIALLTPPVGLNLFVLSGISNVPLGKVIHGAIPYVVLMLLFLVLVIAVPALSTWLPKVVYGA